MSCEVINPTAALPELEVVEMHIHTTTVVVVVVVVVSVRL